MFTLIVTGGIGSGKSVVARHLASRGAARIDLDEVARDVRESGDATLELTDRFGMGILRPDGSVDAHRLAQVAFSTEEGVKALDDIMHPLILKRSVDFLLGDHCTPIASAPVSIIEVPLLQAGSPYLDFADEVIAIAAPVELRVARAVARGMDEDDVRERIAHQPTDEERAALADTVIDNSGTKDELFAKADAWWDAHVAQGWESRRVSP